MTVRPPSSSYASGALRITATMIPTERAAVVPRRQKANIPKIQQNRYRSQTNQALPERRLQLAVLVWPSIKCRDFEHICRVLLRTTRKSWIDFGVAEISSVPFLPLTKGKARLFNVAPKRCPRLAGASAKALSQALTEFIGRILGVEISVSTGRPRNSRSTFTRSRAGSRRVTSTSSP
jgi:hypothetical protein